METPNLGKILERKTDLLLIMEFLEFLKDRYDVCLCIKTSTDSYHGHQYALHEINIFEAYGVVKGTVLETFIGLDPVKVEEERRLILDELQARENKLKGI